MADVHLLDPQLPASLARVTTPTDLDRLEREIAREIEAVKPADAAARRSARNAAVQRGAALYEGAITLDLPPTAAQPAAPIDDALREVHAAFARELEAAGLSPKAIALLQVWVDTTADARAMQQQIAMKRAELAGAHALKPVTVEVRPRREGTAPAPDPLAMLSAAEIGAALGLHEQTVRARERAGQLISILRSGRKRGQEFPAFQTWPGVAGEPLERTLSALMPPNAQGPVAGPQAYGFFTTPIDLLADLAPLEVLVGRALSTRPLDAAARDVLSMAPEARLDLVLEAARATAASDRA